MYRLVRLNEVRYTDSKKDIDLWTDEGFIVDEAYAVPTDEAVEEVDLNSLNKIMLVEKAQSMGIVVKSTMNKEDIIKAIQGE